MRSSYRCLSAAMILMVLLAVRASPAADTTPSTVTLKGKVTLPDGKPAAGAEVGLMAGDAELNRQSRPIARTQSNAAGEFTFADVKPGTYRVVARADAGRGVTTATVKSGEASPVTIALEASRGRDNAVGHADRPARNGEVNTRPAAGERYDTKLKVGDPAPDFTLASPDGKTEINLSSYKGKKPVVLVFGSFTCPPFRDRVLAIDKMYDTYKDRAEFLMVYTREAHPDSVIRVLEDGKEALKKIEQTEDLAARNHNAALCTTTLKLHFPAVVDKEDNKVNAAYAGWPSRLIVVSADGKVAYDGGQGPGGFQPAELQKWLDASFADPPAPRENAAARQNNAAAPERPARAAKVKPSHADVSYGDHNRQAFDIWLAQSKDGKPTPLVIYIHGGGFRGGDKSSASGQPIQSYLDEGISFASMNYRLSDVGTYPMMMLDAARGLQTIRFKSKEWNLDSQRIACYGGSAGAGISLWLGFHHDLADPKSDDPIARQSTRIVAAGTMNGQSTYDLRTFREWFGVPNLEPHPALVTFYGVEKQSDWESDRVKKLMTDASAITHLTKDDVPVYMTYGAGDVPVDEKSNPGLWVHHARLGLKLKEAMEKLGLECHVTWKGNPSEKYPDIHAFLRDKVSK